MSFIKPLYQNPSTPISPDDRQAWLSNPPPWRDLRRPDEELLHREPPRTPRVAERGKDYVPTGAEEINAVNLALWLRRPLLVRGPAGVGKSSLAYGIAAALDLGDPLRWEIDSQTTLQTGLYTYDAVGHFRGTRAEEGGKVGAQDFITLGPLGTAFLPTPLPRVLLIDELDKGSYDLANNLLHILEEGSFRIPELSDSEGAVQVRVAEGATERVRISAAGVRAHQLPVVVITSNDEREFSPAFLRRCVQLEMGTLDKSVLEQVVRRQFRTMQADQLDALVGRLDQLDRCETDVALQALFAASVGGNLDDVRDRLKRNRGQG